MRQLAPELLLRSQLAALGAQLAGRDAYLKLAQNLEDFLAQLRDSAAIAIEDRQQVLRLLVRDVLIGPGKITIRHRIPACGTAPVARERSSASGTEGDHRPGYLVRWGP